MAIKKYFVKNKKPGFQYDKIKNQYFSWGYDIRLDDGRRVQERGFGSRKLAESAVAKIKLDEKNSLHGFTPTRDVPFLIELFQKKLDSLPDPSHERWRAKRVFERFLSLLPDRIRVTDLKTAHIQEFIESRLKDVSAATVRRELVPVVSILNSAYLYFAALEDYRPPRIPKLKVVKGRKKKIVSFEERQKIFDYLLQPKMPDEIRNAHQTRRRTGLFYLFCFLTVSRPGEVAQLKKTDVDFNTGIVQIYGIKTRYKSTQPVRYLTITPTMEAVLRERMAKTKTEYLFTRSGKSSQYINDHLKAACAHYNIPYGKNTPEGIVFHTARHTGTTTLLQSNQVDVKTVGAVTGHADQTMTLYYTHTNRETLEKASEILEQNFGINLADGEFLESKAVN